MIFAVAATSRAGVQITTRFPHAPLAYTLSLVAAVVDVLATVGLARSGLFIPLVLPVLGLLWLRRTRGAIG